MRNAWLVLRREYLERVRTRAFVISTFLVPILMLAFTVLPSKLAMMRAHGTRNLVLVVSSAAFGDQVRQQITSIRGGRTYDVRIDQDTSPAERNRLRSEVNAGSIDGFLWATDADINAGRITYAAQETSDFVELATLERAVSRASTERRLAQRGISPDEVTELLSSVELQPVRLEGGRETRLSGPLVFVIPLVLAMLLYTTLAMYGIAVMRSVLEEKTSRIVEVMLACVTPKELMAGKIMGVGAVGLTQILIWTLAGAVISVPTLAAAIGVSEGVPIPLKLVVYMPVFFVLGYLLYSASFAALGASVNSEQEAQQLQILVMMPLILAVVVMWLVIRQPNSALAAVLSLVPFFAPILMPLRLAVAAPPVWQTALCIALLIAAIYFMIAVCARIYRIGILMYGKRATLGEIVRWLRYA